MALHHNWSDDPYNEQESKPVPDSIRYSKSEPRVARGDVISKGVNNIRYYVVDITIDGQISCKMLTNERILDPRQGASFIWTDGDYIKIR